METSAQTGEDHRNAGQALKRLKTHRTEMLEIFMKDNSLSLISTLHSRSDHEVTAGSKAETEDLNKYRPRSELKLDHLEFSDSLLISEFEQGMFICFL